MQQSIKHNVQTQGLADVLEKILDKGIVIAGDIKINLCDVELLTIQIRLVICSVDKAVEMGMDWWKTEPYLGGQSGNGNNGNGKEVKDLQERMANLEKGFQNKEEV